MSPTVTVRPAASLEPDVPAGGPRGWPSRRPPDSAGGPGRAKPSLPGMRGCHGRPGRAADGMASFGRGSAGPRPRTKPRGQADDRDECRRQGRRQPHLGPRRWSFSRRGCCDLRANSHLEDRFGDGGGRSAAGLVSAARSGAAALGGMGSTKKTGRWVRGRVAAGGSLSAWEDATVQRETALDAEFGVVVVRLATPTAEHDPRLPNQRRRRTRVPAKGESTGGSSRQKRGHARGWARPCPWPRTSSDRGPTVP